MKNDNKEDKAVDNQTKKRSAWILGTFVFGIFLIFLGQYFWPIGFVGFLLALLGPLISLYLVKPSPKEREQYQQFVQVDKKSRKWPPVLIGIILFAIIIGIVAIGGEKENPSENTQFQQKVSKIVRFVNSQNGLRLRVQPSLSADVLEVLKDKTKLEVLREQNGWSEVKVGKKQGWVASKYLRREISDELAVKLIKETLEDNGLLIADAQIANGRGNGGTKGLVLSYKSTATNRDELLTEAAQILGVYIGLVKEGWDIDELAVIVGDVYGNTIGMWYCTKEWTNDLANGKMTPAELSEKILSSLNSM